MVGGVIVDVVPLGRHRIWVNCADTARPIPETCAIYVDPADEPIEVGDSLWWHGGWAMWTPADGSRTDVRLMRLSYSGVQHPDLARKEHGLGAVSD